MKIAIVGIGRYGREIARHLTSEKHNIVVIDENSQDIDLVVNDYDVLGYCGNGASLETLTEAGVKNFDVLIATTSNDEVNIISCLVAKKIGVKKTIARITNTEYVKQLQTMGNDFGVDHFINPDVITSHEIHSLLRFPSAIHVDTFSNNLVDVVEVKLEPNSVLVGLSLYEIKEKLNVSLLICAVKRDDKIIIPHGDFNFQVNDDVYIVISSNQMVESFRKIHIFRKRIHTVFIAGGGRATKFLASKLVRSGCEVKIFEIDSEECKRLSDAIPEATVINASPTDQKVLMSEGLEDAEALIALTKYDEDNMILSAYAKSIGVKKVITRISKIQYDLIINNLGLETVISPMEVFASAVIRYVRNYQNKESNNSEVLNYYRLISDRVEAYEFAITKPTKYLDVPLKELKIRDNMMLASITRDGEVILPGGDDVIKLNDRIVIISNGKTIQSPDELLK